MTRLPAPFILPDKLWGSGGETPSRSATQADETERRAA
jgi:hypothetical protein